MTTHDAPARLVQGQKTAEELRSVMDRAIDRLDSPASFIPAVHDPARDERESALREWRLLERMGRDDEAEDALARLRDITDRWITTPTITTEDPR